MLSLIVLLCRFCIAIAITILIVVVIGVMIAVCTLVFCSLLIVLGVFLLALIVMFVFSLFFLPLSFMVLMFLLFLLLLLFVQDGYYLPKNDVQFLLRNPSHLARLTYASSTYFDGRSAACEGGLPGLGKRDEMSHKETLNLWPTRRLLGEIPCVSSSFWLRFDVNSKMGGTNPRFLQEPLSFWYISLLPMSSNRCWKHGSKYQ